MEFLWYVLIGIAAGFLAGKIMKGKSFGLWVNLVVGIAGAIIGGWVFSLLGINVETRIGSLVTAVVGAIILLWLIAFFKKKK